MESYISQKFGNEWIVYHEIIPSHKIQFLDWILPVQLEDFKGKRFLDAGCGIGRNSLWPLQAGAASAYLCDFDPRTVDVAKNNLKDFPNCKIEYRSIYEIPFKNEFDIAFCIGVIHHLEHPQKAVRVLVDAVKPGGTVILWVYAREGNRAFLFWFDPLRKLVTSHLPFWANLWLARLFTALLKLYLLLPSRNEYLAHLRSRTFRHAEALVLDQLIPTIAHYWTKEQTLALAEGLNVDVSHITHVNGVSWTLVLKKRVA